MSETCRMGIGDKVVADIAGSIGVDIQQPDRSVTGEIERGQVQITDTRIVVCTKMDTQVNRIVDEAPDGIRPRNRRERIEGISNGLIRA